MLCLRLMYDKLFLRLVVSLVVLHAMAILMGPFRSLGTCSCGQSVSIIYASINCRMVFCSRDPGWNLKEPENVARNFKLLRKYQHKLDCPMFNMPFICEFKPKLNKQCDSIRAKLFINYPILHCFLLHLLAFLLLLISNHLSSCDSM